MEVYFVCLVSYNCQYFRFLEGKYVFCINYSVCINILGRLEWENLVFQVGKVVLLVSNLGNFLKVQFLDISYGLVLRVGFFVLGLLW